MFEPLDGHAGHQKLLEDSVADQLNPLTLRALFVVAVVAAQLHSLQRGKRGVVFHTQERRQHGLANHFGEGLALIIATLPLPFQTMANDFMKENGCRTARQKRWTVKRFYDRGLLQPLQILRDLLDLGGYHLVAWQFVDNRSVEGSRSGPVPNLIGPRRSRP